MVPGSFVVVVIVVVVVALAPSWDVQEVKMARGADTSVASNNSIAVFFIFLPLFLYS
jgi:hypothetical protein